MSPGTQRIRLLLVDDHFVARFGVKKLLALHAGFEVVAEARNGAEAVTRYREHRPDLVLMDLRMDGFDGISATKAICNEFPTARILIVSSYDTELDLRRAKNAGALGFVVKESGPVQLLDAIRRVGAGETYLPDNLEDKLDEQREPARLSAREMQLLRLIVAGMSNREIAARTSLTLGTVKVYICHLLAKLKVANRSEAIFESIRQGLVRHPGFSAEWRGGGARVANSER